MLTVPGSGYSNTCTGSGTLPVAYREGIWSSAAVHTDIRVGQCAGRCRVIRPLVPTISVTSGNSLRFDGKVRTAVRSGPYSTTAARTLRPATATAVGLAPAPNASGAAWIA